MLGGLGCRRPGCPQSCDPIFCRLVLVRIAMNALVYRRIRFDRSGDGRCSRERQSSTSTSTAMLSTSTMDAREFAILATRSVRRFTIWPFVISSRARTRTRTRTQAPAGTRTRTHRDQRSCLRSHSIRSPRRRQTIEGAEIEYEYEYRDAEYEYDGSPQPINGSGKVRGSGVHLN